MHWLRSTLILRIHWIIPNDDTGIAVLRLPKKATPEDFRQTIVTFVKGLEQNPIAGRLWIVEKGRIRLYQQDDEH